MLDWVVYLFADALYCVFSSVRSAGEGGDGAGDPAVWEDQSCEGGTAGETHTDLSGTGREWSVLPSPLLTYKNNTRRQSGP